MMRRRVSAIGALAASTALLLAACSSDNGSTDPTTSPTNGGDPDPVTLTWWHNGESDPMLGFWADVAAEFEADNPHVTIEIEGIQNEDLQRTRIPVALQSGDAPDLFQQWGGGEQKTQADAGHLMDLTPFVAEELDRLGGSVAPWITDGKAYGLPFQFGVEGIWYRISLFEEAGITSEPSTIEELNDAVQKLKDAGITPIAVGAGSGWPAAHWWYNFALQACPQDVIVASGENYDFSHPCFVKAGEDLEAFIATEPFQAGFNATVAQEGATSSAGQVATGQAAMELMGHWNVFVLTGLLDDEGGDVDALSADLGWFPMPGVTGGEGDPSAALGGGDGFSCHVDAPVECVDLLKYIVSDDVQARFAEVVGGLPVAPAAASSVTNPNLVELAEYASNAAYVQLWLDTTYGQNVGGAMNDAIVTVFAGTGTAQGIVDAMTAAAANE